MKLIIPNLIMLFFAVLTIQNIIKIFEGFSILACVNVVMSLVGIGLAGYLIMMEKNIL